MTVVVYTQPSCYQCKATTRHLDDLIAKGADIQYETTPIDDDVRKQASNVGITSAPIVLVIGKALWGGYRPDQLDALAQ